MIPIIGLIVAVYTVARCVAEVSARQDGTASLAGRVVYGVAAVVTLFLAAALIASGPSTPHL